MPQVVVWFNDSVGPEANGAYEATRDEGGMRFKVIEKTTDLAQHVPAGQPVEIFLKLYWNAKEGASLDYDILVDVPGTKTSFSPKSEDMNWNFAVKTMTVNTIGVAGVPLLVGVEAATGRTTEPVPFSLSARITYVKDVLTPYHPWAFQVPANASGIVLESEKGDGDEHVTSEFVVIGPDDQLVQYVAYNDLAIPTESVFIPTPVAGEYVFYAHYMVGGFLSLRADFPPSEPLARPLALSEVSAADVSGPVPGMVERDWLRDTVGEGAPTPMTGQQETSFTADKPFPLRIKGYVKDGGSPVLAAQVRISSQKGIVYEYQRVLRVDRPEGSVGYTNDQPPNQLFNYANIVAGAYKVEIVNDSPAEIGHVITSYVR